MEQERLTHTALGRLLRERGKVASFGDVVLTFASLGSTNDTALDYVRRGLPHGSVVMADEQTAGRGRRGRAWISPPGVGLYLTALLRGTEASSPAAHLLPLAASVAAAEALRDPAAGEAVPVVIRWPNDLYVGERKLAGILCEATFSGARLEHAVVGVGINVNHEIRHFGEELAERATSLRLVTGRPQERVELAARLVERLEHWWDRSLASDTSGVLARWRELAEGAQGMKVLVERSGAPVEASGVSGAHAFEATTAGLAEDGGLRVRLQDGRLLTLYSAEVVSLRPMGA